MTVRPDNLDFYDTLSTAARAYTDIGEKIRVSSEAIFAAANGDTPWHRSVVDLAIDEAIAAADDGIAVAVRILAVAHDARQRLAAVRERMVEA